jgi:hypothetical protein
MTEAKDDWCLDLITYILEHRVPEEKVEWEKITRRSANYVIIDTELYWRSPSNDVLMKCILGSKGLHLLQEIHGGECATTQRPITWWERPSRQDSTGLLLWSTLRTSSGDVNGANSSLSSSTS